MCRCKICVMISCFILGPREIQPQEYRGWRLRHCRSPRSFRRLPAWNEPYHQASEQSYSLYTFHDPNEPEGRSLLLSHNYSDSPRALWTAHSPPARCHITTPQTYAASICETVKMVVDETRRRLMRQLNSRWIYGKVVGSYPGGRWHKGAEERECEQSRT